VASGLINDTSACAPITLVCPATPPISSSYMTGAIVAVDGGHLVSSL
jgi:hypothetical protein